MVDHTCVNADQIPQAYLDQARQLDVLFAHQSVGGNIMEGIADLQSQNWTRYHIDVAYNEPASWHDTHDGIGHRTDGFCCNFQPERKVSGFDNLIRSVGFGQKVDVAFMKFCYVDFICRDWWGQIPAQEVWETYRQAMEALEADYPNVTFVWWTAPLHSYYCNDEKALYNGLIRNYCIANGKVLFDLAAIESHDPEGNPVLDGSGYEALYTGYTTDGGHLNEVGRQRVARALWWLLAAICGWQAS
ncbi:MAG: SGNH/GDSL hydrolase family protein [Chloroflexi bacterium]|nr:SGNH/GDSL hydrolase family protein [Chloroflexota bacterium]